MGDNEDSVFEQFIEFFVGVTLGREGIKPPTKENIDERDGKNTLDDIALYTAGVGLFDDAPSENPPSVLNIIRSESITRRAKVRNKQTINEHTSNISQTVNSSQKVKIKCGTRPFYDHEYELKDVKYDLFGNEIEGSGCPRWGCCYDVAQTGEVQLIAINNTLLDQTNKMYNQTIQEITHHLNATIDSQIPEDDPEWYNSVSPEMIAVCSGVTVATAGLGTLFCPGIVSAMGNAFEDPKRTQIIEQLVRSINESKDISTEKIKNIIEKSISQTINTSDTIDVEYISPLLCVNKCGEAPTAGTIDQSLLVDAMAENITKVVIEEIEKSIVKQTTETETTASTVNMKLIYTFAFGTLVCLVVIYVVSYLFIVLVWMKYFKEMPPPLLSRVLSVICCFQCWCYFPVGMFCCFHRHSLPYGFLCVFPGTGHITKDEDEDKDAERAKGETEKKEE